MLAERGSAIRSLKIKCYSKPLRPDPMNRESMEKVGHYTDETSFSDKTVKVRLCHLGYGSKFRSLATLCDQATVEP